LHPRASDFERGLLRPKLILGVKFADGLEVIAKPANRQPTIAAA